MTSAIRPPSVCSPAAVGACGVSIRTFSGRIVNRRPPRSSTFDTPMKPGDELARRALVDLDRRPQLFDPPAVEHGEAVAHRQRLLLIVRHEHERDSDFPLDPLELELHLLAELQVERPEWLVQQEHLGLVDDRPGERDALPLPARELARLAGPVFGKPHHRQRLLGRAAAGPRARRA